MISRNQTIYDHKATTTKNFSRIQATESETQHNHERAGSTKLQEKKKQESRE
jgi:hypothetical protein